MEIIHNIFSAHNKLSPAARKAWTISRRLLKEKHMLAADIDALIAIDSDGIAPFRMALTRDGSRHGSTRREMIVDAIGTAAATQHHTSTAIALLASFIDDQEGMVAAKAITLLAPYGSRVDGLLLKALKTSNRWGRSYAARALGELGGIRAVPSLISALQDKDDRVRSDAAEALGKLGDNQATQPLFGALTDPNWLVRESASSALATFSNQEMIDKLTHFLSDPDHHVRAQAVRTLGNIIDSSIALNPLIAALDDTHFEVQWDAIDALATLNNSASITPLLTHYHQGDKALRDRITSTCNSIGIHHVVAHLTHAETKIRVAAAEMMGQQQNIEPLAKLAEAWQYETDHDVQMWITIAIGQLATIAANRCPNAAIHALIAATKSPHRAVRYHANKALESLKHPLAEQFIQQPIQTTKVTIGCPNCLRPLQLRPPLTNKQWHCPQCNLGFTIRQGAQDTLIIAPTTTTPTATPTTSQTTFWFDILKVDHQANAATIQQAFRSLLKQYHPDKVATLGIEFQQLAEEKTRQLTQALRDGLKACQHRH